MEAANGAKPFCIDLFGWHKANKRTIRPQGKNLCTISQQKADEVNEKLFDGAARVLKGQKWCSMCRWIAIGKLDGGKPQTTNNSIAEATLDSTYNADRTGSLYVDEQELDHHIGSLCTVLNLPLNYLPSARPIALRDKYRANVLTQILETLRSSVEDEQPSTSSDCSCKKSQALQWIMAKIEELFSAASLQEKKQLLSLTPPQMTYDELRNRFGCSNNLIAAKQVLSNDAILHPPPPKRGRPLPLSTKDRVVAFYRDSLNCRTSPGMKDVVQAADGEQPRRWLLHNIGELYDMFAEKHPEVRISLSRASFFALRPIDCVPVGSKASHIVCVCSYHQNFKLLLEGLPTKVDYKSVLAASVCSITSIDCMFSKCSECPGVELSIVSLRNDLPSDVQSISYRQWTSGERAQLITPVDSTDDFFGEVRTQLEALKEHHYIAGHQRAWISECAKSLPVNHVLAKFDFSEKYLHVVQDEVQSFHWNNVQTTVHPIALHIRIDDQIEFRSLCVLSDHVHQNVSMVYAIMKLLNDYLDNDVALKYTRKIYYVSDGCAGQYKNRKNFHNLSLHQKDFGREAEWIFHETLHGKCECDGIGGIAKSVARRASLQGQKILSSIELYKFLSQSVSKIKYFWLPSEQVEEVSAQLQDRFAEATRVLNCRSYHHFVPVAPGRLRCFRASGSEADAFISGVKPLADYSVLRPGMFVAIVYEKKWYLSTILEISDEDRKNREIYVSSMRQRKEMNLFSWPSQKDACYVVDTNVLCVVSEPTATNENVKETRALSNYVMTEKDFELCCNRHLCWKSIHFC